MDDPRQSTFLESSVVNNPIVTTDKPPKRKTKDGRNLGQFRFFIDANNPGEAWLGFELARLLRIKRMSTVIKAGLRLVLDLQAGRTDELFRQFPWARERLQPATPALDTSDLQQQIAELKALLLAQKPETHEPSDEYKPTEVSVKAGGKASAQEIANNFLASMSGFLN